MRITVYDDLVILDETEMLSTDKTQISAVATNLLKTTRDAEVAEVYDVTKDKVIMRFVISKGGKVTAAKADHHPNWGGKRPGSGKKPNPDGNLVAYSVRLSKAVDEYLCNCVDNKAQFIRDAVAEKIEREKKQ